MFYPSVDHLDHVNLERDLREICDRFSVKVVDVPSCGLLPNDEGKLYAESFSDESLYVRSLPDKLVQSDPPFLVDAKTAVRKDTGNFSIELSSFHFNLQRCKTGIRAFYVYRREEKKPWIPSPLWIFSPLWSRPSAIFIQPKWDGADRQTFLRYAHTIKEHFEMGLPYKIPIHKKDTGGSRDPFVLIPIPTVKECSINLANFLSEVSRW